MTFQVLTKNFKLNQTKEQAFNTDTILLANFIKVPKVCKNILDIGTGSGVLMLDLAFKTNANIFGVEIQEKRFIQAKENIMLNDLSERLEVYNKDLKEFNNKILFDMIVSNPPFFKVNNNQRLSENLEDLIARHEVSLTLEDLVSNVSRLLKYRGTFYLVHRPDRLEEIIYLFNKYNIVLKTIRFVHPYLQSRANHVLIKGIKNGNLGLDVLNPLIIYKEKHEFTEEMKEIIGDFWCKKVLEMIKKLYT